MYCLLETYDLRVDISSVILYLEISDVHQEISVLVVLFPIYFCVNVWPELNGRFKRVCSLDQPIEIVYLVLVGWMILLVNHGWILMNFEFPFRNRPLELIFLSLGELHTHEDGEEHDVDQGQYSTHPCLVVPFSINTKEHIEAV